MKINLPSKNIRDLFSFHSWAHNQISYSREQLGYFLLAAGAVFALSFLGITIFLPFNTTAHATRDFFIEQGEGSFGIASKLEEQGFIRSRAMFTLYAFLSGRAFTLQDGHYVISPAMSAHAILRTFATGDVVQETITLKEGWNLRDIAREFGRRGFFSAEELYRVTGEPGVDYRQNSDATRPKDFSGQFAFLQSKPEHVSLEGYLFPDTYKITARETPESFVKRALKNFEEKMTPEIFEEVERQGKTLFEVLTMASILEKEVRSLEDKKLVAGILWKRLANDMRLQVDATVVYVRKGNYYKVTIDETKIESPYNTYRNEGLPPGPISNPGLESIEAALYPTESPYWFYASPSLDETIFSRTFEEHKAAADQYVR